MVYRAGDLKVSMNIEADEWPIDVEIHEAYLPHSCDEWVIGGPEHILALIADLQAALAKIDGAK